MSSVKELYEKGLTRRALVIGAVCMIALAVVLIPFMDYMVRFLPQDAKYKDYEVANIIIYPIYTFFIISAIIALLPSRLTKQEMAVVFSMLVIAPAGYLFMIPWRYDWNPWPLAWMSSVDIVPMTYSPTLGYWSGTWLNLPPWVAPRLSGTTVAEQLGPWLKIRTNPPQPMPVEWYPWIIFWTILTFAMYFCFLFLGGLSRKLFIDVEELPFPAATAPTQIINSSTKEKLGIFKNKWLWLGILIAFIVKLPWAVGPYYVPPGWKVGSNPYYFLVSQGLIPLAIGLWPTYLGLGLFLGTDVLISFIVFFILLVCIVYPSVAISVGFTPPGLGTPNNYLGMVSGNWVKGLWQSASVGATVRYAFLHIYWTPLLAALIWMVWTHRSTVLGTISSLWRKPPPEEEAKDPFPYRIMWIGAIVTFVIWLALILASVASMEAPVGLLALTTIVLVVNVIVVVFGGAVLRGQTGFHMMFMDEKYCPWASLERMEGGSYQALGFKMVDEVTWTPGYSYGWMSWNTGMIFRFLYQNPLITSMEAYRVGEATKTRSRDIFLAGAIGLALCFIVFPIVWFPMYLYTGMSTNYFSGYYFWVTGSTFVRASLPWGPFYVAFDWGVEFMWIILWTIVFLVLYVLRARMPRKLGWLNPVVIPLLTFCSPNVGSADMLFSMFIIALIIRYLVVRVYGAEAYAEKVTPMATGLFIGVGMAITLTSLLTLAARGPAYITNPT